LVQLDTARDGKDRYSGDIGPLYRYLSSRRVIST